MVDGVGEGLFGIFMAFVVLAGMIGLAFVGAKLIAREPKCLDCGRREGHRMDCKTLDRLVDAYEARNHRIMERVHSGELSIDEARALLKW